MQVAGSVLFAGLMIRMALRLLGEPAAAAHGGTAAGGGSFLLGLVAAASNPVTVSFFAGYFLGHPGSGLGAGPALACATVFVMAAAWFSLVGIACARLSRRAAAVRIGRRVRLALAGALVGTAALTLWRAAAT
ncbi:MAG: LysE family transporter [Methylobacterium frigidaeris]